MKTMSRKLYTIKSHIICCINTNVIFNCCSFARDNNGSMTAPGEWLRSCLWMHTSHPASHLPQVCWPTSKPSANTPEPIPHLPLSLFTQQISSSDVTTCVTKLTHRTKPYDINSTNSYTSAYQFCCCCCSVVDIVSKRSSSTDARERISK